MKSYIVATVLIVLATTGGEQIKNLPEYVKQIATSFFKVMEVCKVELDITDGVMIDFYHLWKEEYDSISRNAGCMLVCMSKKLDIFNHDSRLHHENAKEFAMKNGADEHGATQIVTLVHDCEQKIGEISDECIRTLELTKCVRGSINQINWTPKIEVLVGEIAGGM